jgi:hypothetical protein
MEVDLESDTVSDTESVSDCESLWEEFDEAMAYMTLIDQAQCDALERAKRLQELLNDTIYIGERDLEDVLAELHDAAMKQISETGETNFLAAIKQLNFTPSI